jgi:hypothetical protein
MTFNLNEKTPSELAEHALAFAIAVQDFTLMEDLSGRRHVRNRAIRHDRSGQRFGALDDGAGTATGVPEPATPAMMRLGFLGRGLTRRRSSKTD